MSLAVNLIVLVLLVLVIVIFWSKISSLIQLGLTAITNSNGADYNFTLPSNTANSTNIYPQSNQNESFSAILNYTLVAINKDRATYGLRNVTLSAEPSAQQHADSMLQYNYFSHWDIYGMKPYMRYAILGGTGAMQENIAYTKSSIGACIGSVCKSYGNVNVTSAISGLEYSMMYNDSACCDNGHRDNILNPEHNQVSIGVAFNSTTVYLVEDFINNYITWLNGTPSFSDGQVNLKGVVIPGYTLSSVEVTYDPPVVNMTQSQLDQTSDYGYGNSVAGVVSNGLDYYQNLTTIVASTYYSSGSNFLVSFNMSKLVGQYGAGEYTVLVWLNGTNSSSFIGSSYTTFINSDGKAYTPRNT
jgi:uncharacterized protein YkwD